MRTAGTLKLTTPSDREIAMTRVFDAPRKLVYDAHTQPELVKQWLLGPPGWSMPVCEMDVRVGGKYRWEWRHDRDGTTMGMGGVYRAIVVPERIVTTEQFDEAWYPGESLNTLVLVEKSGRTTLTQTMRYESREARDAVLKSGMEQGVTASYDRLADLLASTPARGGGALVSDPSIPPRRLGRSVAAVLLGFFAVAALSLGTDQVFHVLGVYPPWGQPMWEAGDNLLAFAYRSVYAVVGGYIAARLAPRNPMRHVLALGILGFLGALAGAIATIPMELGPDWYPVALVVTAFPLIWLGGVLYRQPVHQ